MEVGSAAIEDQVRDAIELSSLMASANRYRLYLRQHYDDLQERMSTPSTTQPN